MKNYNFLKIILIVFLCLSTKAYSNTLFYTLKTTSNSLINTKKNQPIVSNIRTSLANVAPIITATGSQVYCPQTTVKIATAVTITDPDDSSTDAIYIQVSSGYINGQDQLTLTGSHPTIISSWDVTEGKLKLYSPTGIQVSYVDFISAIKDVEFYNSSLSPSGIRNFSISIGQANYLPSTQHYYLFIPSIGITWTDAKIAAEASTYYGIKGYLATVGALDEAQLIGEQASGTGWIGGSDAGAEGVWKWVTGPENGTVFWNGLANGYSPNFAFWNSNEPNQSGDEDYAHITEPGIGIKGSWNDLSNTGSTGGSYQPKGYVVEYGGMPGDPILQISTSTSITIPQITIMPSTPACISGTVTLQVNTTLGTIKWYDSVTGGTLLGTGASFITPFLTASTTYYAEAECNATRIPIVAIVNLPPSITSTNSPVIICGAGNVILLASTSLGSVNWYATATDTNSLATGTSFTVPNVMANITYYAQSNYNGCSNGIRVPIEVIVYNSTPVVQDEEVVLCEAGNITLDASLANLSYLWSTGETTQTIIVSSPGIYSVDLTSPAPENCSSRKTITVEEHLIPEINRVDVNKTTIVIYLKHEESYYEYSVDGINYQSSNVFFNVPSGLQRAYVRDKDITFCDDDSQTFIVLIIPEFFTPNNDGHNDFWEIKGLINYPEAKVTIFDRYGKFITQLNASKLSWDGSLNKYALPASDYWYVLKIDRNSPEKKGHFSLKR